MSSTKRRLSYDDSPASESKRRQQSSSGHAAPYKRLRVANAFTPPPPSRDIISTLSDELLVRVLSYMGERTLLEISLVSKRFHSITADGQLWRQHYYRRFILPRAHRIPGFKTGPSTSSKLQYSAQRSVWADGGWGRSAPAQPIAPTDTSANLKDVVDWKKQYRLRHNWSRGSCALDEVPVSDSETGSGTEWQTLVKVVDGTAVTADLDAGLRVWDLRTRRCIAQSDLETGDSIYLQPTCLSVDEQQSANGILDMAIGFEDGTFGIWRLNMQNKKLMLLYRQDKSFLGSLVSVAYTYPYLMTAAQLGFISLYTFAPPDTDPSTISEDMSPLVLPPPFLPSGTAVNHQQSQPTTETNDNSTNTSLPLPYLLSSLKSYHSRPPLALSIRKLAASAIASIAYTFDTVGGWSIGIQDFDVRPAGLYKPDTVKTRLAYTLPTETRSSSPSSPSSSPHQPSSPRFTYDQDGDGPVKLCYSHPYLLATLPDNTLVLHLCTSNDTSLSISKGIRLWGHTSGISDAEITPRGKAVSVSTRGDEIRVWELEGRIGGGSVEVRPRSQGDSSLNGSSSSSVISSDPEDKKNYVGFDDERVVVLKEAIDGKESLMVYDFT